MNILSLALACIFFSGVSHAKVYFDRKEQHKDLVLKTGKENGERTYRVFTKRSLPYSAPMILKSITNFTDRCNNNFVNKREFMDKSTQCKYHHSNIIESFVVKDLHPGRLSEEGESERYLLGRRTYNRETSSYYELVQVFEGKNKRGQKTYTVTERMLTDKEVATFTHPKMKLETPYGRREVKFILTEISPTETQLKYVLEATTSHWLMNKELLVPQVFGTITKSINDLVAAISTESGSQSRSLASEQH